MKRPVLLDTNVLLCLVDFYEGFSFLAQKLLLRFEFVQFCVPDVCAEEATDVLRRRGLSEEQAKAEIMNVKRFLKYVVVKKQLADTKEARFLLEKHNKRGLHYPDNIIVAIAKRTKVWRVYTTDNTLVSVLRAEGLDAKKFPTKETLIDMKFRKKY